jgi:uncharacterized protein
MPAERYLVHDFGHVIFHNRYANPCYLSDRRLAGTVEYFHDGRLDGHLKNFSSKPWWIAALASWGIALFEYLLQVPANRIGYTEFSLAQLKIVQEVITLLVFVPFAIFYMNQPFKLDYVWAALCLIGAVYFIFRA